LQQHAGKRTHELANGYVLTYDDGQLGFRWVSMGGFPFACGSGRREFESLHPPFLPVCSNEGSPNAAGAPFDRPRKALELLAGVPLYCLGTTRQGHPRHPLYVRANTPLVRFAPSLLDRDSRWPDHGVRATSCDTRQHLSRDTAIARKRRTASQPDVGSPACVLLAWGC
jgi:hypothetical protein